MGCGHSKINIYPRKSKSKSSSKKSVTADKTESEEEDGLETEAETSEDIEDCDQKKAVKFRSLGGPLLAQPEISSSQQNFFKMLDEKIQNGPDYNSESEGEKAAEACRLKSLLKDWETASAGSRSLPPTPKKRSRAAVEGGRTVEMAREMPRIPDRAHISQIPQSIIHQSYGVTQVPYRQATYNNPNYISHSPSHQMAYPSAMQYQAISPMYTSQPTYQPPQLRQYPSYNQHGSPIKTYVNSSPKHIPYDQQVSFSPTHRLYGPVVSSTVVKDKNGCDAQFTPSYTNGELLQQQKYNHQQQSVQYQQYKEAREQVLAQNQQNPLYRGPPKNYQNSVTVPIVVKSGQQSEMNKLHRQQYGMT
ncbi:hypothetical protein JTB14_025373 [Gonioctena quinquepunctata]|nr:hypothetical protein JTB14_025373 [Gonioctena quinquepunctata]